MKVAAISTFRVNCGVAKYFEELAYPLSKNCELKIFAEDVWQQPKENEPLLNEPLNYIRCWKRGESYDKLKSELLKFGADVIHIQFQNFMYNENLQESETELLEFIESFKVPVFITLHDVIAYNTNFDLPWYREASKLGCKFITTNQLEVNELEEWNPNVKCATIPLGATIFEPEDKYESKKRVGISLPNITIIQPGFWGADKGMLQLIEQMPEVNKKFPNIELIFVGSIHPLAPQEHRDYVRKCILSAMKSKQQGARISFVSMFVPDNELNTWLSAADILVLNHTQTSNYIGASAMGKRILCAGKPLIFSSLDPRLSEFKDGINCLKINGTNGATFLSAVEAIYNNSSLRERLINGAKQYAIETSFKNVARKHIEVFEK
jgi:glycosyltransferase involved in cell wall biosynthesis